MTDLAALADKDRIADTIHRLFDAVDERDWRTVHACMTERVLLDMSSLSGEAAVELPASEVTDAWDAAFKPLDHVHHQVGNLRVELRGDEAGATCHGIAFHHRALASGPGVRRFVGTYELGLRRDGERWRVRLLRFEVRFVDGVLELEQQPRR
jgi:hypothetical protein